jgi:hypothetical protein
MSSSSTSTWRSWTDSVLALVQEIEGRTIEKILATSDLELGIEALLGLRQGEGDTRG